MKTARLSNDYILKWQIKHMPHIQVTTCKKLINVRTNREIKETVNGYSKGFWLGRKFVLTGRMNDYVEKIEEEFCPF